MNLNKYFEEKKLLIDNTLKKYFKIPKESPFAPIYEAMLYTLFPGGKRIRAILTLAAAEALKKNVEDVLHVACALEAIHNYSLIHDDLPCIDNDDFRRGKPSNHKVYGEDIAVLAGDGLLTLAFEFLSDPANPIKDPKIQMEAVYELSRAAGPRGMVGGQACEVQKRKEEKCDVPTLDFLHIHKTGMLLRASVTVPAKLLRATETQYNALKTYGSNLGLAFQIVDDIADMNQGKSNQVSYPAIISLDECRSRSLELKDQAIKALSLFGSEADPLRHIASFVVESMHDKKSPSPKTKTAS